MDAEQSLLAIRELFVEAPKRYEHNEEALKKVDEEIQDLLHVLELGTFNASEGYKLAKEIQKLRKERRILKDEMELFKPIKEFLTYQKPTEKNISKTIGDIRNMKNRHQARGYRMRVRNDLENFITKNGG